MKTYTIVTNIIDSDGNVVATPEERDISADEVIELLAGAKKSEPKPKAPVAKRKYTKREKVPAQPKKRAEFSGAGRYVAPAPCGECGSKGRRHKKGCSKTGAAAKLPSFAPAKSSRTRISQMTFGRIKISQSHDIDAEQIARNLDIDVAEVEKAFECEAYSDYQNA